MRVFVALSLPDELTEELDRFCEARREADGLAGRRDGGRTDWSWTLPEQWHVTLAFAAEVGSERLALWDEALVDVAARAQPLALRIAGAGTFPHPDAAKVLYLRVTESGGQVGALEQLARAVRTAAQRVGVECDGRRFTPHLTVARSRRGVSATRWLRVFDAMEPRDWSVSGMQLVRSEWPGATHRAVHRVITDHPFPACPPDRG